MTDDDIQTAYRTMERALTPTPEAITAVHRAVASRQRSRRVILGLGTLAVATGVTSAAIGLSGAMEPDPSSSVLLTEPGQAGTTVREAPAAPDGMRFVGVDNLVVAVPAHWSTNDVHCGQPLSDTVYFHSDGQRDCLVLGEQHPATLAIAEVSSAFGEAMMQDAHPMGELSGIAIWKTDVTTVDDNHLFQQAVGVPDLNVLFVATAPSRSTVEAIVESLRLLPDGYTTVPFDPYWRQDLATTLRKAGLHVQVTKVERPELSGGTLVALRPPPGSVIRVGDSVTLTLAAGSSPNKPDVEATPAPSTVQLDCPDGTRSAGHVDGIDLVKSTATPQEIGDGFAAGRQGDQNVTAHVVEVSDTEAVVAIAREDGTVNTVLRLTHSDEYGWRMDSIVSCGHSR